MICRNTHNSRKVTSNMNRGKRFAKKTIIYSIGNFGSRVLTFLMVPYYTFNIPTAQYGIYDVLHTTMSLLLPLFTLQTQEAIIAGMIDKEKDNRQIVKSTFMMVLFNSFVITALFLIANNFIHIQYGGYFIIDLAIKSVFTIVQQYARGLGKTRIYAVTGIIFTFIHLSLNILYLSVLHSGIEGLFISEAIAAGIVLVIILIAVPEILQSFKVHFDKSEAKRIIKYSFPLIPNAISWWLINASDRYVIKYFIGNEANGIYAISYKFANIIQAITGLIYLAWQEMSLEEYNSKDRDVLYSSFFNSYIKLLLSGVFVAICCTKFLTLKFLAAGYSEAWKYTAWLYMGTVYSAMSSFLNTVYLARGETGEILKGTLFAGFINVAINILLIRYIGIYAASFSTVISTFALMIRRITDNKKYYKLTVDWKTLILLTLLCVSASFLILLTDGFIIDGILLVISLAILFIANKMLMGKLVRKLLKREYRI